MASDSTQTAERLLTVSELTSQIKAVVETKFPRVSVLGEISNLRVAASGHVYLTLKDDAAQIKAVIWRSRKARLRYELQNGLEVVVQGAVEVYPPHGKYQLIIDRIEPQGIGALELAFRQLQNKLAAEGLFSPEHKQPLPRFPRRIALVTSPAGAAVRDLLQVITRRWKATDIVLLPVPVQGDGAASKIAAAIDAAADLPEVDLVITGRGGGSLEDLWAFNEEVVARAIFDCPLPVISAVGHEIDVSIADLVADRRALTPSEAGEIAVPDCVEVRATLDGIRNRLITGLRQRAAQARARLESLASRRVVTRPLETVHDRTARLDELAERLTRAFRQSVERRQQRLAALAGAVNALSPFQVLQRGYSVTRKQDGAVVRQTEDVTPQETIHTQLLDGTVMSRVQSIDREQHVPDPVEPFRPAQQKP